jgi:hypothetical protein
MKDFSKSQYVCRCKRAHGRHGKLKMLNFTEFLERKSFHDTSSKKIALFVVANPYININDKLWKALL